MEGRGYMEGGASPGMVETRVSFTSVRDVVFIVVVVVFLGCFCSTSSTTFTLLGLVDFFVISTFFLGAIWTIDGDREDKEEEVSTSKDGRETERNREERETESSNDRGILGRDK